MIVIYSVALLRGREVVHCDLTFDGERLVLEKLASRGLGRARRGLSRREDMILYKIEKMRTKESGSKEKLAEIPLEELICWRLEEHTGKGLAREYENTVLFILKVRGGTKYRMLVSKKALKHLELLIKKLRRAEIERCKKV